ncbi:DMT family transporter [Pseudonocardia sp. CA-107938]|uniref:DMT family transporter n=1 Tax=Pseudonocardia sp. CA-107938 TaxID=3240021 RepID=UPI003D90D640
MTATLLLAAVLIGGLLAVQASANLQLTAAVGTPYGGATVQLWFAVVLLAVLAAATGSLGALASITTVPGWYLLGGLASPLYITSAILLFPRLGALAAGGLFVTGQVLASILIDLFGLFGTPVRPLGLGVVIGAVAVLAGITAVVRGPRRQERSAPGWLVLGVLAGAALPVQGAVNARLRAAMVEPLAVALVSFVVAAMTITVVLAVLLLTRRTPRPQLTGVRAMPWWGWLGGACAAAYVTGTFLLIPAIGAAVTVALTVTGQQLAAAAVDARGWFRLPRRAITTPRLAGLALLVTGSVLVQLS